ncbi:MAG TPA: hypothetical protein DCQ26_02340 [Marinilabiliales bacterium]|nr:MAG: hypothetical protein A2W84_10265 [Bacteroidetes bacterium GWC2_40_13]OFX71971.1 MAG: hypothetical protein A2W96_03350 [Bacteroidetes bacterium GWD2_40_43]OFX89482.1 MAG: hypothetical protein A2W97_14100 [Bacteroidetes bacterium GWE2_40_63]OFY23307.1 MAG: hypothetical protein A2W88_19760 [Bacteroidetes bacterium GWF2_40_13]OFZ28082.1 MAG: hypothetical protein A2437_04230 [Bacteroidetes bacterium RIFOXYC2_FULL_40_12]HAM97426.1 hypothetical protein [Marinilabiliales bacterium]
MDGTLKMTTMKRILYILFFLILAYSCKKAVLKVESIPGNTPQGAPIYVTGNFNHWDPGDSRFQLHMKPDSTYMVELPRSFGTLAYKFTRGNWSTVEANRCGNDIEDHQLEYSRWDTISHRIECWRDLEPLNCDSITIIVESIPLNTPVQDSIKIAGSFNAWNPGTKPEFLLRKNPDGSNYFVTVPRISWNNKSSNFFTYKFIRKDITISEADRFGREKEPRVLEFERGDTVVVQIDNWSDMAKPELNYVTIVLTAIPENTPKGDKIYLAGNFNDWNPGDDGFIFRRDAKGKYMISLPRKKYGLSFKITRGSWWTEFTDKCGHKMNNQEYNYDEIDTLYLKIENWLDLPKHYSQDLTLVINQLPKNTPGTDVLYLIGHEFPFGNKPEKYAFTQQENGLHTLTMRRKTLDGFYVVCRGTHRSQEVDEGGRYIFPRHFVQECSDTVFLNVAKWNDLFEPDEKIVTVLLEQLPKRTPEKDNIYITGKFNGWDPGDANYILKRDGKGACSIQIPLRYLRSGFKFTRGDWNTVEGNFFGGFVENRTYTGNENVVKLKIESWGD